MTGQATVIPPVDGVWMPTTVSRILTANSQSITAYRNGVLERSSGGGTIELVDLGGWNRNRNATIGDPYEIFFQVSLGPWGGSPQGVWLSLSSSRSWTNFTRPAITSGDIFIRRAGSLVTLAICSVTFSNIL